MPPRSKNGSTISSQVSASTRLGGGNVAPARRQSSSHTSSVSAITTNGGMTLSAMLRARVVATLVQVLRLGGSVRTVAAAGGSATTASVFRTGMFISNVSSAE